MIQFNAIITYVNDKMLFVAYNTNNGDARDCDITIAYYSMLNSILNEVKVNFKLKKQYGKLEIVPAHHTPNNNAEFLMPHIYDQQEIYHWKLNNLLNDFDEILSIITRTR